ncbi:hypothetical protein H0B56_09495 [Haloechinothrix sp. YIM 98757]|uniref:Uncharacterized protein n=1 Tax=Haloechinothrix aidingensis TaxID=2752311 RepID=A0A838A3C5_9PSEU|nr:choice-of-anchor P family protein [Haloechinothrix aidingensis]MBA0125773.1 hypothetical protein [Haloechinothrix aidingensis]
MRRRAMAGAGASAVGAATAVTALVLGSVTGHAQTGTSEAFGVEAVGGALNIDKTPHAVSDDGVEDSKELANVDLQDFGNIDVLKATAGDNSASAKTAGVDLGSEELGSLSARVINVQCDGEDRSTEIVGLGGSFGGEEFDESFAPDPNTEIPADPLLNVTFNKQFTDDDGRHVVQGVVIEVLNGDDLPQELTDLAGHKIVLSSATCGGPADDGDNGDGDDGDDGNGDGDNGDKPGDGDGDGDDGAGDGDGDGKPTAPKPTPTETELPVTG